jgi:hypothetical protein
MRNQGHKGDPTWGGGAHTEGEEAQLLPWGTGMETVPHVHGVGQSDRHLKPPACAALLQDTFGKNVALSLSQGTLGWDSGELGLCPDFAFH